MSKEIRSFFFYSFQGFPKGILFACINIYLVRITLHGNNGCAYVHNMDTNNADIEDEKNVPDFDDDERKNMKELY